MTAPAGPRPQEVADFYGRSTEFMAELIGGSLHFGYWDDALADDNSMERASRRLTEMMVERIRVKPGDRVLDIGCGTGLPAIQLAESADVEVIGITISPDQAELATTRAAQTGMSDRVTFRCADAMDLPFEKNSFDAVWFFESIFHMPDRLGALRQAASVLSPGGRLALTDVLLIETIAPPAVQDALEEHAATPLVGEPMRLAEYPALLEEAGFLPDEATDITEQTVAPTLNGMRRQLERNRTRLAREFGDELVEQFETAIPLLSEAGFGYGIVTATRP